ncbi:MAG: DNA-binding response regulator [Desmonostoc vinosum HA7617-LM4]|jgi:YesN/AraC family two-component response regulator|nr:DNA-binding response regulator [Desmonostoc vinosum HA7617-LM4]
MVKTILVIDNRASTRNLFLEFIKAEGFYTIDAENGLIGVQQAQEHLPDLIISEIMMPKLDGYSVLTTLRQNPATAIIPLIFVTTKGTRTDVRKGMELGADDYLTQPCTVDELLRAIAACLEKRATLQKFYTAPPLLNPKALETDTTRPVVFNSTFLFDPLLSKIFCFIETNYYRSISLSDVAFAVGYCPNYLTHLVRRRTGQTVQRWIIDYRMAAARSLLLKTDHKVEQIAQAVGYDCAVHFFRQFRQHHGSTPQAWRKAGRNNI